MNFLEEIAIEMMRAEGGRGRETPHLVVSLDCLAEMMLEDPNGPTQCDVAAVMALVCRAAAEAGNGDPFLAVKEQARYEAEARGGEDGDDDVDRLAEPEPVPEGFSPCGLCGWPDYCKTSAECESVRVKDARAAAGKGEDDGPGWDLPDARDFL